MVSDRQGDCERQLPAGESGDPEGEGIHPQASGGVMIDRTPLLRLCRAVFLGAVVSLCLCVYAEAQPIYAANQIPARGVEVAYTVTIRNPMSHLFDVEMSIRGIRDTSVSVSMPAWSPGIYRIENYARNVQ